MKKILFVAAVVAVIFGTSCTREENEIPAQAGEEEQVTLQVSVPVTVSKATETDGEENISSLQVFIFRTDGTLDASDSAEGSSVKVSCTVGTRDIVALVNAPTVSGITTKSALEATVSDLSDNSTGAFVMYGEVPNKDVSSSAAVTVEVTRLVARVSIAKITNAFALEQYQNAELVLTGIYLINVAGDVAYAGTYTPTVWYNKQEQTDDQTGLLYSGTLNSTISYNSSYETAHYFYCYPNPTTEDSSEGEWCERFTRLVVEVTVGGATWFYPINIEGIQSNHTYDITELRITKLGSKYADEPISTDMASFNIAVSGWDIGSSQTVEI